MGWANVVNIVSRTHDGPKTHIFPYVSLRYTPCLVMIPILPHSEVISELRTTQGFVTKREPHATILVALAQLIRLRYFMCLIALTGPQEGKGVSFFQKVECPVLVPDLCSSLNLDVSKFKPSSKALSIDRKHS